MGCVTACYVSAGSLYLLFFHRDLMVRTFAADVGAASATSSMLQPWLSSKITIGLLIWYHEPVAACE